MTTRNMRKSGVVAALLCAAAAHGGVFVSTGQLGAQVQCDIAHMHHWTYSVTQDTDQVTGALLYMKAGSHTTATVSFVIIEGTFSGFGTATPLLERTLTTQSFTQSFEFVEFTAPAITLLAGHIYTAVLYSDAADPQDEAYFIKGGSDASLSFVDESGTPITGGGSIIPPVPAPGALAVLVTAAACRGRRRRV